MGRTLFIEIREAAGAVGQLPDNQGEPTLKRRKSFQMREAASAGAPSPDCHAERLVMSVSITWGEERSRHTPADLLIGW